ncbi:MULTISPECIES: hypothetical protein [unclassified Micromonospora]|uniref:hypothetical protein n=1 Tax=unclassified Micromonospora TaxID=2617518 RepID=UPI001F47B8FC|nr:hypothetical protein [Micromonospora sp. MH99]MCF0094426.1 hypothetical protein [Micromonospora sp. MH99]
MSIGEIKAALREVDGLLGEAAATVEEIGAQLAEATSLTLTTLHDSQHDEANKARTALTSAKREVELILRTITVIKDNTGSYRESLG